MADGLATDARIARVAISQEGAFTRGQAVGAGYSPAAIERRLRAGAWERVLPRVYRHAATPASVALLEWAAVLWVGTGCALSHASAAGIWRIAATSADRPELIVPRSRAPRSAAVLVHRVTRIDDGDIVRVGVLPVTSPLRTIIDLAGVLSERDLEVALRRARFRGLVTVRAVQGRLDEIGTVGRPGAARLRALLAAIGSGQVHPSARMAG
jgi:hypothetical protein